LPRWFDQPPEHQRNGHTAGWRARLSAAVRRRSLDRRLLDGESPATSGELSERAQRLLSPTNRRRLAESFEKVAEAASQPPRLTAQVPLRRRDILENRPLLLSLSRDLEADESVNPRGVILASRLLCDGGSPLYSPSKHETLGDAIRHARAALHLR
jgi:hypothetical protein